MNKKIIVQITLFFFLLIIVFFFYYKYFFLKKEITTLTNYEQNPKIIGSENNLIKNLEYLSADKNGNKYLIKSEYGEISGDGDNVILMTGVTAQIDLFEKDTVFLSSNFAKYNTLNFETNFNKNVILKYTGHEISSENLDLSFEENFVWVYNDIIYKSSSTKLFADKVEIDLLTKDSRIFMFDNKKLRVIGK